MRISRLENITEEKRTNLRVGSSDLISLDPLKAFFLSSSVPEVLMIESIHVIASVTSVILSVTPVILTVTSVTSPVTPVIVTVISVIPSATSVIAIGTPVIAIGTPVIVSATSVMITVTFVITTVTPVIVVVTSVIVTVTSFINTTNDYTYDLNGNMISDKNKNITSIKYNYLNLPTKINFLSGDFIEYKYNAAGQKISKFVSSVNTNNTVKLVEYLDGFQYTGEELNFFPHAEGYVNVTLGTTGNRIFNYVYNYTDHLGNIRLSYTKDVVNNQLKILEENNYYPFGLKHQKYSSAGSIGLKAIDETTARPASLTSTPYAYKYNGKEFQDELGLGLYDYGARNYDPALGRWMNIDPLAEMYYSFSTYNYAANNPIVFIDPNGMNLDWYQDDGGDYVYDTSITSQEDLTDAGIEGTYLGESASFGVTSGGEQIGNVNLNADGSANFTTTDGQITEFNDMTVDMGFESGNKIMAGNYQNGDLFDKGNFIAGAGAMGLERTRGSFRFGTTTQGFSPKYYGNNWGGNQYSKTFNIGRIGKALGPIGFGAGVVKDGIGVVNGTTSFGKAGLNTTMGALGFTGWGLPASLLYGGLEAFYPGQTAGAMADYSTVQSAYRDTNNGSLWKSQK